MEHELGYINMIPRKRKKYSYFFTYDLGQIHPGYFFSRYPFNYYILKISFCPIIHATIKVKKPFLFILVMSRLYCIYEV